MLLRHYLEQGSSKSALARQLGVSGDTIHRWIGVGDLDRDQITVALTIIGGHITSRAESSIEVWFNTAANRSTAADHRKHT